MSKLLMSNSLLNVVLVGAVMVSLTPFMALVGFLVKGKLRRHRETLRAWRDILRIK